MEQVFIILAVLAFWIFKGVAGAQRRVPGQDPYEGDPLSPDAPRDVVGATRQQTLEAQQRAIEALQRWEEKQGLSAQKAGPAGPGDPAGVPGGSRTRVGRPAATSIRGGARQRKEAFADIARMLDPAQSADRSPRSKHRFAVDVPAEPAPSTPTASVPAPSTPEPGASWGATDSRSLRGHPARDPETGAMRKSMAARKREPAARAHRPSTLSSLARIEALPLAARAIVYAEILGPPRSLS